MNQTPLFTAFVLAYRRLGLLQEALDAIRRQTYKNLEIIVVSNGATQEIVDYLNRLKAEDNRVKIIFFSENQSPDDDPGKIYRVCWNAALKESTGEYIWYQSDDDLISDDYVEKMVALFLGNPECTTAAGLPKRIDVNGQIIDDGPRLSNYRPRYMPGHLLALSTLFTDDRILSQSLLFSCSGVIFAIKKDVLVKLGGYYQSIESSQMYGIVPFGVTGFDESAFLYFRKHDDQANIHLNNLGHIGLEEISDLIDDWKLKERWAVFGKDTAEYVVEKILESVYHPATLWFVINLYYFRFKSCSRIFKGMWLRWYFWIKLPGLLWTEKRQFWYYIKPKLRLMIDKNPSLFTKIPMLNCLKRKVYK